jgi:hypothetical protein
MALILRGLALAWLFQARDPSLFYQMELAALMRDAPEAGLDGRAQSGMIITRHKMDTVKATLLEAFKESAPVRFGFTQSVTRTENSAVPVFFMPMVIRTAQPRKRP